ncbi:MAG TPA: VWA domain-containing protein, partial [Smithella sp.]|nr:VWA domain-containing protein [Smithella sp.]
GSIPGDTGETDAVNQLNASGGVGPYTYSLVGSATGDYGTIQINPDGSYIYTLTKPYNTTPDADNGMNTEYNRENFAYRVTDANGNTATGTITVNIVDDVPSAADQSITVTDNLISGSLPATFGADGPAVLQVVSIAHDADGDGIDEIYNTSSAGYNTSTTTLTLATQAGGALAVNFSTGDYTYTGPASATLLAKDVFTYEIMDADGDTASATLTVNLPTDGMLVVGTNEDDTDTQTVDHYIDDAAPYAGVITGSGGNDVLVGDVGGADNIVQPGHNYNISLIVDSSGSMDNPSGTAGYNRMELAQAALKNLADQLVGHDGTINLQIIDFDTNVVANTSWSHITSANLSAIYTAIDNMVAKGGTNYEAAFDASRTWLSSQNNGYENITFFLTDGNPTYYLDSRGKVAGPGNTTNYDTMSNSVEAFALLSPISHVEAIGIGSDINENYLKFFDNTNVTGTGSVSFGWYQTVTGPVGQVEIVNTAEELSAALQHGSSEYTLFGVGDDHIVGGDGDDIIFGGSVHTDALADAHSLATADGAGWKVFEKLGWTEEQIVNYINEHHEALAAESGRTGDNDIIYGGAGNDIIYGQEGNDIIYGGEGNDILNGGSGNDILSGGTGSNALTGGSGADTFTLSAQANDTVKDYSQTDGDKVDISAILDVADEAVAKTYLGFHNNGDGKAVLEVYNSSTDHSAGNLVSCITFDNITDATSLDSLLGKVDIDHDA